MLGHQFGRYAKAHGPAGLLLSTAHPRHEAHPAQHPTPTASPGLSRLAATVAGSLVRLVCIHVACFDRISCRCTAHASARTSDRTHVHNQKAGICLKRRLASSSFLQGRIKCHAVQSAQSTKLRLRMSPSGGRCIELENRVRQHTTLSLRGMCCGCGQVSKPMELHNFSLKSPLIACRF